MTVQYSLVKYGNEFQHENLFLKSLYHRWILRCSQTPLKSNYIEDEPNPESVLSTLPPAEKSVSELMKVLEEISAGENISVLVPTPETFKTEEPNFSIGHYTSSKSFCSMIHLDMGIYFLYKGQTMESIQHFVKQEFPLENFPYLRITPEKLNGYMRALEL